MYLPIDFNSGIPIYRQIVNTMRYYIASGMLHAGDQVPSIRDLCVQLRVNPATVNKAFRELEISGYLETRRGLGTFVAPIPPVLSQHEAMEILSGKVVELLTEAQKLGLATADIIAIIESNAASLTARRREVEDDLRD